MSKNVFKSIGAVLAGFVLIAVLSTIVDTVLENNGVLPKDTLPLEGSEMLIVGVLAYRALFSLAGCYLAAWLAPSRPMRHAIALGVVGIVVSGAGSVAMTGLAPAWYGIALVVMSLPIAWLGGKLYELTAPKRMARAK